MRKNNKGFTLVELLAALVILGVLALLATPTVINLLGNSRDKLYVTDAKKLISQAEYKFRSASSEIEKPDDGECLVLSLVYLDNSDFDNAPNNGRYVREASYVVVKNNNGNYEFSVELVEEIKKGSYKGVELTKDSSLKSSSVKHVVSFTKEELHFVENNTAMGNYNGKHLDTSYINSKLGSTYVNVISKVYNYPDLADSTYNGNFAIPKITRAEYVSASNKNFNSLDATLKIVVNDVDTKTKDLEVIVGPDSAGRYPELNAPLCEANQPYNFTPCRYPYGILSDFSLNVDFSKIGLDYSGATTSLYIIVLDPEGNTDRINPAYTIHTNQPPVINLEKSGIFKKNNDNVNLADAVLRLFVSDDTTLLSNLEYCITEDIEATTCANYAKYANFNNSELNYTFKCGGEGCSYTGGKVSLKVFLRDDSKDHLESSAVFDYTLFNNDTPEIVEFKLKSDELPFVDDDSLALTARVGLKIKDQSSDDKIEVHLAENASFDKNLVKYKYSDFKNDIGYTFDGIYDGSEKTLFIRVIDEFGTTRESSVRYGKVHRNEKPDVDSVTFKSNDLLTYVCPETGLCEKHSDTGGDYGVEVTVVASDDIVSEENLFVCISDDVNACKAENKNNFVPYATGKTKKIDLVNVDGTKKYNGQEKNIYVAVYDGYADGNATYSQFSDVTTHVYKIYKNQPPEINKDEVMIESTNVDYNFKNVNISFKVQDDLDLVNKLKYSIREKASDTPVIKDITVTSADEFTVIPYEFSGDYDGVKRNLILEVYDSYGASSDYTLEYSIHKNEAPKINYVAVDSNGVPCASSLCANGNSLSTKVSVNVQDDLDLDTDNLKVCIRVGSGTCSNYVALKDYTGMSKSDNGDYILPYTISSSNTLPYNGSSYDIYVYVKDSLDAESYNSSSYTLYNNKKAEIDSDYPKVVSSNNSDTIQLSTFKFELKATDDFKASSSLKYNVCYTTSASDTVTSSNVVCLKENGLYDYVPDANGVSSLTLDLGEDYYEGQEYYIFAKVYDDYAQACYNNPSSCSGDDYISYTSMVYYRLYDDIAPTINKFTVSRPTGVSSYETLNVVFNVSDPLDTYKYCLSDSEDDCDASKYVSTSYDGDSTTDISTTYKPSWARNENPEEDEAFLVYLHIKDSHNHEHVYQSATTDRIPCESEEDAEGNPILGTHQDAITFELLSGSQKLTADVCQRKCYWGVSGSGEAPVDITSYYKKTVVYVDKEDRSLVCNKDITNPYEAHCNFKTCYENNAGGYYPAVGYILHENTDATPFSHTHGTDTHVPDYYRYEYSVYYDETADYVKLTKTGNKICNICFENKIDEYKNHVITYDNNEEFN